MDMGQEAKMPAKPANANAMIAAVTRVMGKPLKQAASKNPAPVATETPKAEMKF